MQTPSADNRESTHDNISEDLNNSSDNELLKEAGTGIIGKIENLPLWCKLILLIVVSLTGMVLLGAAYVTKEIADLSRASTSNKLMFYAESSYQVAEETYHEMLDSVSFLLDPSVDSLVKYEEATEKTNKVLINSLQKLSLLTDVDGSKLVQELKTKVGELQTIRKRATEKTVTAENALKSYRAVARAVLSTIRKASVLYGENLNTLSYVILLELGDASHRLIAQGAIAMANKDNVAKLLDYRELVAVKNTMETLLLESSSQELVDKYRLSLIETQQFNYQAMQQKIYHNASREEFTFQEWIANATSALHAVEHMREGMEEYLTSSARATTTNSAAYLILSIVFFLFFFIAAPASSFFFSRTIIGPFKRLNEAQEFMIAKFVPRGFLKLMKWNRISDVEFGKCYEKEVSIVVITIQNFFEAVCCLEGAKRFKVMNDFMTHITPCVLKGFIDKNMGEVITVVFTNPDDAMKCAAKLHTTMPNFNKLQSVPVPLQISTCVVSGKCAYGTVGETTRMESLFISRQTLVGLQLSKVCYSKFKALFVTTSSSLANTKISKKFASRLLGNMTLDKLGQEEVVEIILPGDGKQLSATDFTEAVQLMHASRFIESVRKFEAVLDRNPDDTVAHAYKVMVTRCIQENARILLELTILDVLKDKSLKKQLEDHAATERSLENMNLYHEIQRYKEWHQFTSPLLRRQQAARIRDIYLNVEGAQSVNITKEAAVSIHEAIQNLEKDLTIDLFDYIEREIQLLMEDTLKRAKRTAPFLAAFHSSSFHHHLKQIQLW